jgi:hypothetical protein
MQYLILAVLLLITGEDKVNAKPSPSLSCQSVQEIAATVLEAPGLTTKQKNQIIGRLYGRHLASCGEYVEDANVDEGTG